jgi:DNA ligase (NAD+)
MPNKRNGLAFVKRDYVILGEEPGSKYDRARALGIRILDEKEFKKLLGAKA